MRNWTKRATRKKGDDYPALPSIVKSCQALVQFRPLSCYGASEQLRNSQDFKDVLGFGQTENEI